MSDQDDDQRDDIEDDEDQDDGTDTTGADDEEDTDDGDDDPWAGKTEAELKAELKKTTRKLGDSNRQAKTWREKATGKTPAKPKVDDAKTTFTKAELEAARQEALDNARTEQDQVTVRIAARSELKAAGLRLPEDDADTAARKLATAVKLLDLDGVLVEDGDIIGLAAAIDTLKETMPELFGKGGSGTGGNGRRPAPRPGNAGGGGRNGDKPKTATELQSAAIFGGR